jgi:hypothetical protein
VKLRVESRPGKASGGKCAVTSRSPTTHHHRSSPLSSLGDKVTFERSEKACTKCRPKGSGGGCRQRDKMQVWRRVSDAHPPNTGQFLRLFMTSPS